MSELILNNKNFKCKNSIVVLSVVALALTILSSISYFMGYIGHYDDGEWIYEFSIHFPGIFSLLSLAVTLAPYILFTIYVTRHHSQFKSPVLVSLTIGLLVVYPLFTVMATFLDALGFAFMTLKNFVIDIPFIILGIVALISSLKGMSKKIPIILFTVIGVLGQLYSFVEYFQSIAQYIEDGVYLYLFTWPVGILGAISLHIALFILCFKNRIPTLLSSSSKAERKVGDSISPEQALRLLKEEFESGMITEEEYQTQRTEIISKL